MNDKEIHLKKKNGIWRWKLDDVATYDHGDKGYVGAFYSAKPSSNRYIDLHERLGHQVIAERLNENVRVLLCGR